VIPKNYKLTVEALEMMKISSMILRKKALGSDKTSSKATTIISFVLGFIQIEPNEKHPSC
jgi:hypothetical protein